VATHLLARDGVPGEVMRIELLRKGDLDDHRR
jgi:hypothetical protein